MMTDFSPRCREVLSMARLEAVRLGTPAVLTEHILLALLKEGAGVGVQALEHLDVPLGELTRSLEARVEHGTVEVSAMDEIPYTTRAKQVLAVAMQEAGDLGHPTIGTEHLLLGLAAGKGSLAAKILAEYGVTLESARAAVLVVRQSLPEQRRPVMGRQRAGPHNFQVRLDDASNASIYEQIIAQVQEAVASGLLKPMDRLPTVRSLADSLDIAPGTVSRAYSELERLGLVVTDGARGTRIAEAKRTPIAEEQRTEELAGLMRPVIVAAYHLGAKVEELRAAFEASMKGIFGL